VNNTDMHAISHHCPVLVILLPVTRGYLSLMHEFSFSVLSASSPHVIYMYC